MFAIHYKIRAIEGDWTNPRLHDIEVVLFGSIYSRLWPALWYDIKRQLVLEMQAALADRIPDSVQRFVFAERCTDMSESRLEALMRPAVYQRFRLMWDKLRPALPRIFEQPETGHITGTSSLDNAKVGGPLPFVIQMDGETFTVTLLQQPMLLQGSIFVDIMLEPQLGTEL